MAPLPAQTVLDEPEHKTPSGQPLPKPTSPALTYDPETGRSQISRRQFRFLLGLTLVNTLMLGAFVAGPGISKLTRGWWDDYKRWRADRQAAKQAKVARDRFLVDYAKLLAHRDPPDKVVYDEDPDRAARLIKNEGYTAYTSGGSFVYLTPKPWQFPARAEWPMEMLTISKRGAFSGALLYLEGRKSPSGEERLVCVVLDASLRSESTATEGRSRIDEEQLGLRQYVVKTRRALAVGAYKATGDNHIDLDSPRMLEILQPSQKQTAVTWTKTSAWENGEVSIRHGQVMRFFAGQADPADPSHFTIKYEYNGQPGGIDGWLRDDGSVVLEPRVGRIVQSDPSGRTRVWDMDAEPTPTKPPR
jgi:hypothetical protein